MEVGLLTREFPPEVYGGAGVHVEYLARELAALPGLDLTVHCFGADRPGARAHRPWAELAGSAPERQALQVMSVDLAIAAQCAGLDLVHSHTWYANLAGHLAGLTYGAPHVMTTHSLEPLRPWKAEQLGGGYALSSYCERTAIEAADAVVAVSHGMARDVLATYPGVDESRLHVITNGIDVSEYAPDAGTEILERHGVDPSRPSVAFVGRITRQKGLPHLLAAARSFDSDAQVVLLAGAPDTPEIAAEVAAGVEVLRAERDGVVWVEGMVSKPEVVQVLSAATVFVCPSVYEPLGIVNLEAMACGTAVVASAVGGIPEVVVDGSTGLLVSYDAKDATGTPLDPARFASDIAEGVNALLRDPQRAAAMGQAGRERAVRDFSWRAVAEATAALYRSLLAR